MRCIFGGDPFTLLLKALFVLAVGIGVIASPESAVARMALFSIMGVMVAMTVLAGLFAIVVSIPRRGPVDEADGVRDVVGGEARQVRVVKISKPESLQLGEPDGVDAIASESARIGTRGVGDFMPRGVFARVTRRYVSRV